MVDNIYYRSPGEESSLSPPPYPLPFSLKTASSQHIFPQVMEMLKSKDNINRSLLAQAALGGTGMLEAARMALSGNLSLDDVRDCYSLSTCTVPSW